MRKHQNKLLVYFDGEYYRVSREGWEHKFFAKSDDLEEAKRKARGFARSAGWTIDGFRLVTTGGSEQ